MTISTVRKPFSGLALAIALASGSAIVATALMPAEAHAQRKKDKKKKDSKPEYTKEFVEAYGPVDEALKAEGADPVALKPQIMALVPLAATPDDKNALGGMMFNAAVGAQDQAMQLQGMELMLESGKVEAERLGRFNFIAYQLANAQNDFTKARTYLQRAIDLNYTSESVTAADLQILQAENFFSADQHTEGLAFLDDAIKARKSSGAEVPDRWYRRGIQIAYNNEIKPQVYDFVLGWIEDYPSPENWKDAVNLTRNLNQFENPELLDIFRLSRKVGALTDAPDYDYYVEAADARRLPKEVKDVIEAGFAAGDVSRDNSYLSESLEVANGRIASDRADLPALESDARSASAQLRTVTAAASAFLSYGEYGKAIEFYTKALGMPGVETGEALTRLGIAQAGAGDFAAARETFAKVDGKRAPIAKLWMAYTEAQSPAAAAEAPSEAATDEMTGG
ncbi:hypothetical protein [Erythrobacter sp. YT30]|uniref:hypothetical protein n=1 Tax=Erythrobacter sp. YT30 TaxID=1735012 RepID=UPI00076C1102|nr:hypothetical protein [Erythrobacter sp. YT30]KWV93007.1 hypothetical protein AUC45_02385 [Erythrobacter sp. YT30]